MEDQKRSLDAWVYFFVEQWIQLYPELHKKMMDTEHYFYDEEGNMYTNDFHMENSVWTHTLMVLTATKLFLMSNFKYKYEYHFQEVAVPLITAIVHDVGKVYARTENPQKNRAHFKCHGPCGTLHALDFATKMMHKFDVDKSISEMFVYDIVMITSRHMDYKEVKNGETGLKFFNNQRTLIDNYDLFNDSDCHGRITITDNHHGSRSNFSSYCEEAIALYESTLDNRTKTGAYCEAEDIDVWLYCGIPGSGKDFQAAQEGLTIFSYDSIRIDAFKHFSGEYDPTMTNKDLYLKAFEYCRNVKFDVDASLLEELRAYYRKTKSLKGIAICNTMISPKARRKVINLLKRIDKDVKVGVRFVLTPLDTCIANDISRGSSDKTIGADVITQFAGMVYPEYRKHGFNTGIVLPTYLENVQNIEMIFPYL